MVWRLAVLLAGVLLSGCFLTRAHRNNTDLATITSLKGHLRAEGPRGKPRWVVLFKRVDGRWTRYSQLVFTQPGPFEFLCLSGQYLVFAFEDSNEDGAWQPAEPAGRVGSSEGFTLTSGQPLEGIDVTLGTLHEPPGFEVSLAQGEETLTDELVKVHAGDLATLEDERFSPAAGDLGLWQAADFARKWGVGVSFLQPWDAAKVPVLFIHGAGGAPSDFTTLIARLDRSRFQPWVLSYPSGIRLQLAGLMVQQITDDLQQRLRFERLHVVAHSMGGLVARHFVNHVVQRGTPLYVASLVTISTPFGGVEAANGAVERSPVVLPAWIDVAKGSTFLAELTEKPLPPAVPHYVFFGFEGGNGSDGTIALGSQLEAKTQAAAKQVLGFPDDHASILRSAAVAQKLNAVLSAP